MPATKPANTAEFATSPGDPGDVSWPSLKASGGYSFRDEVPYEEFNGLLNRLGDWTAYLNDLMGNIVFTGGSGDYEGAKRNPYTEVAWATNATLSKATDSSSDVSIGLTHSGAGTATWAADRLYATDYAQVRTIGIERGDFSSGSGQAITFTDQDALGTTPTVIHNSIKPALQSTIGGSVSTLQRDQHLWQENLCKARWRGILSNSGGSLAASSVQAFNLTFNASPSANDTMEWTLTQRTSTGFADHVSITLCNLDTGATKSFHAVGTSTSSTGFVGSGIVNFGIEQWEVSGGAVTATLLENTNNISDELPQILVTIEVY